MRSAAAVFRKQLKETLKNKAILIQFVMLPIMAVIMSSFVKLDDMPNNFFVKLFAVMFIGMAPQTCMASIISEERETGTLRVLMMSNVKPLQYLAGTGLYVWLFCMGGGAIFAATGGYSGLELCWFLAVMAAGILVSMLIGSIIGILSKNQMTATSVGLSVMMLFSFVPMLAMFNSTIEKYAVVVYTRQINLIMDGIESRTIGGDSIPVLAVSFLIAVCVFVVSYKKKGLE